MQPKFRKNLLFSTLLACSGANLCCIIQVDAALTANSDTQERNKQTLSIISSIGVKEETHQLYHKNTNLKAIAPEKETIKYFQLSTTSETPNFNHRLELGNASRYNSCLYGVGSLIFSTFNFCDSLLYSQQPPTETPPSETPPPPPPNPAPPNPPPPPPPNPAPPNPAPPNPPPPPPPNPVPREEPRNILTTPQQRNQPPQLEGQPNDFPQTSPTPLDQLLEKPPLSNSERLDILMRRLQEGKMTLPESDSSLEIEIIAKPIDLPPPIEQLPPPPIAKPVTKFKPIGSLRGYLGFFGTNNIFSSEVDRMQDGLVFTGLTLASAPLALGSKTFLSAGIDGNLIFYIDQSQFNYNQVRFYVSIYQQLSRRMYGELGWSNQQLFYAKDGDFFSAGDRFLNENSVHLSVGRRDPLTQKLVLDSFYELRLNFADPDSRNRINNSLLLSLSYYWLKSLQVGLDYQFNLSDFTLRQREDQYHRLYTHLTYGISDSTNVSLQGGVSLGGSTDQNINFDGWFFSLNYNFELGKF
ncbi:hypothetical protein OGM63_07685 [Plectonema radiosum NIES-515]|uniref:Uncharacterized protein n=1 Tax=Plectonema radiosum NIES-515 TaxID=2986073 RepID=A0ABT3AW97_9CYAN|nr:hypothetical protein [Plectonema radiosum]MCV3213407.1 hypothetical protein [Plectonema radiosum NIES-515]